MSDSPAESPQSPGGETKSKRRWIIPTVVGVVAFVLGVAIGATPSDETDDSSVPGSTRVSEAEEEVEAEDYVPSVDDFGVKLRTKEKQCFGEAGCNVTIALEPEYSGPDTGDGSYEITYELSGDESGPIIGSFTLADGSMNFTPETSLATPSSNTEVKVKITAVDTAF